MSWFAQPPTPIPSSSSTFTSTVYPSPSSSSASAPRRRAPHPPYYVPRRTRPRHIRMREPAFSGLFTVSELDEMAAAGFDVSARARSRSHSGSETGASVGLGLGIGVQAGIDMNLEMDVDLDFDLGPTSSSSSMSTLSTDSDSIATPSIHDDDSFFVDVPLDVDMEAEDAADFFTSNASSSAVAASAGSHVAPNAFVSRLTKTRTGAPRRPAPLDLSSALHNHSSLSRSSVLCGVAQTKSEEINRWSREVDSLTPRLAALPAATQVLLPAFGTDEPCASPITPTPFSATSMASARAGASALEGADPVSALESLFGECAEPDTSSYSPSKFSFTSSSSPRPSEHSYDSYNSYGSRSRSASPDAFTIAAFPLPPVHTPVLSPAPDSASTSSSFASLPRTPVTPCAQRRTVSNGRRRQAIACPGAPSPQARREREKARERQGMGCLQEMHERQAWAARHEDLFALTLEDSRKERGGEVEMGRVVSMPERKKGAKEGRVGLGIKGVGNAARASPTLPPAASASASPCSTASSGSRSSTKSRRLPSHPSLPAHWMVRELCGLGGDD